MYLSPMQKKILKYIRAKGHVIEREHPFEYDRIIDLVNKGFLTEYIQCPEGKEGNIRALHGYKLSPAGEAALHEAKSKSIHSWINTGISILALVLSLLQLLLWK